MANESELKIKITSVADTTGTEAQTAALEKLDLTASKTANSIAVAQAKQELAEKAVTRESLEARRESAQTALREIVAKEATAKAARTAAESAKELSAGLQQVQRAGRGANDVINGLAQGGLPGLSRAGKGAVDIFRTLSTGALGPALLGVIAGAGAAMIALKVIVGDAQADIVREQKKGIESAKRYKEQLEANKVASEKSYAAQQKDVEKLQQAYVELGSAVDRAQARASKLTQSRERTQDAQLNLQEQQALGGAKTEDERAAIQRKFSDARTNLKNSRASQGLDSEELQSKVSEDAAQQTITDSNAAIRDAQLRVGQKESAAEQAKAPVSFLPIGSDAQIAAIQNAKAAADALVKEKENFAKVVKEMSAAITSANEKIDAARLTRDDVAERRKGLAFETATDVTARANDARQRVTEAQQPVADLAARRDTTKQKLSGLESDKTSSLTLGGDDKTLQAIEETKAQLAKDDAELAAAQQRLATAQKESAAALLQQTSEATARQSEQAQKQLAASGNYHTQIVTTLTAQAEQLARQSKQIADLARAQKVAAAAKQ